MGYDPKHALLVGVIMPEDTNTDYEESLHELAELAANLDYTVKSSILLKLRKPQARFLVGPGKAEEIMALAEENQCGTIVFDEPLLPSQQRNWEKASEINVIDRQEIILDIFADRAQTKEAVLQVELARLQYELPRMKRLWTHLDRQRGGGAVQRGEGEAQIEIDQRLIRKRIAKVKTELEQVVKRRGVQRKLRRKVPVPTAAIVGYTNAGKSTLLNRLTGSEVLAADKLFATLDPTSRKLHLPSGRNFVATDTVGFVRRLPHRLIQAFKATLEEALVADVLIHVLDASNPAAPAHFKTTLEVLAELHADDKPRITVFNKSDLLGCDSLRRELKHLVPDGIFLSAQTGEGAEALLQALEDHLRRAPVLTQVLLPYDQYDLVAQLHKTGSIQKEEDLDDGIHLLLHDIPPHLTSRIEPFQTHVKAP
jgi:GTP-binding protein HflX